MSALKLPFPFGYLLEHSPGWLLWIGLFFGGILFGIDLLLIDPLPFLDELTFLGISSGSLMELKRRRDANLAKAKAEAAAALAATPAPPAPAAAPAAPAAPSWFRQHGMVAALVGAFLLGVPTILVIITLLS